MRRRPAFSFVNHRRHDLSAFFFFFFDVDSLLSSSSHSVPVSVGVCVSSCGLFVWCMPIFHLCFMSLIIQVLMIPRKFDSVKAQGVGSPLHLHLSAHAASDERDLLKHFRDFLEKCLSIDPATRLQPEHALSHPFLAMTKTRQ